MPARVPAGRPPFSVRDCRRRQCWPLRWLTRFSGSEAPAARRRDDELGFGAPDSLFFVRDRTLIVQRFDLERLELTGEETRVAEGIQQLGMTAGFAVAGGALVYWTGDRIITQPTWFQRDGTVAGTLGPPGTYMNLALSGNGRQVAIDRFEPNPGIWLLDPARGTSTRATSGAIYESTPVWSPDGNAFVFAAARDAPPNLFLKRIGVAGEEERLFRSVLQSFPQAWSPDGRFIALHHNQPKNGVVRYLGASALRRAEAQPLLETKFDEHHPRISPDGRWMAYASNESGRDRVYVTGFPEPIGKWQVSTNGGNFPVWRRDGRELFYRRPTER